MTYEEFKKLVSEETKELINDVLPYVSYYEERVLSFGHDLYTSNTYSKIFFLLIYSLSKKDIYNSLLSANNFNRSLYDIPNNKIKKEFDNNDAFNYLLCVIPKLCDSVYYTNLTPLDLILESLDKYDKECKKSIFDYVFENQNLPDFRKEIEKYNDSQKEQERKILEKKMYDNLSISVISYLETASKVYYYLRKNNIYSKSNQDIVPLSMLIAVYYYQDIYLYEKEKISERKIIIDLFNEKKITLSNIFSAINCNNNINLSSYESNADVINRYMIQYCDALRKKKNIKEITVTDLLEEVFDSKYTESYAIEKILATKAISVSALKNFKKQVVEKFKQAKEQYINDYIQSLYKDLARDPREFIEFTCKTYQLLLEKMKNNTHNREILTNEDDADTLALYISNCYYDGIVNKFFLEYGITLEKVLKLLNIQISEKEIRKVKLDKILLLDRFKRFINDGKNQNKNIGKIDIKDIIINLCNRDFNKSMIMENIFESITDDIDLEKDFYDLMNRTLKEKEEKIINKKKTEFFENTPLEVVEYMKDVAVVDKFIACQNSCLSEKFTEFLSLLISAQYSKNKEIKDFIEFLDINISDLLYANGININNLKLNNNSIDIDLISKRYKKYIYDGVNQDKKKEDITVISIIHNIFNKELNSMSIMDKYQDIFEHFDDKYIDYRKQVEEQNKIQQAKEFLHSYSHSMKNYIKLVLNTDSKVRNYLVSDESSMIKTDDDIALLSLILGIYQSNSSYWKFFNDKNISVEEILNSCDVGITKDDLKSTETISTTDDEYMVFAKDYLKYFEQDNSEMKRFKCSDNIFLKRLFDKSINNSTLLEDLCNNLNISYEVLKKEFEYGKSYEELLTVDERIKMLNETKPGILDMTDIESVMNFGSFLNMHTKYIHNELPKLALSDTNDSSIATINSLADNVYEEEQVELPKQGFLARIFNPQPIVESKKVINYNKINELKSVINDNILALNKELVGYYGIRKYIEAYRQNNNSHYKVVQDEILKLEEKLKTLDLSNDSEYAKFLEVRSSLQVLKNKANRFKTTNQLMKQELLSINQTIVNHFMTVNALEMARDDLIPLIGAEQAIYQGKNTENTALELTQNVVALFQSLLSKNIESTVSHLKELEHSILPIDTLTRISTDVENYLQNLSGTNELILNNTNTHSLEEINIESTQLTDDSFQKQLTKTKKD